MAETVRIEALETRLAHRDRAVSDLSDTVAREQREIARLTRRVEMLMAREAERTFAQGASVPLDDPRPRIGSPRPGG